MVILALLGCDTCPEPVDSAAPEDTAPPAPWAAEEPLDAALVWTGASASTDLGADVAVGDVTGDGADDLVVLGGSAWIVAAPLPAAGPIADVAAEVGLPRGATSLAVGDVDGDGAPDLAAGADGVWLLPGPVAAPASLETDGLAWTPDPEFRCAGERLVVADDVTGDGRADLLASAPCTSGDLRGAVFVLAPDLSETAAVLLGEQDDLLGLGLAAPGDLDGDGLGDVAATVYGARGPAVCAWLGGLGGTRRRVDADACWRDDLELGGLYLGLDGGGDPDGDGRADLIAHNARAGRVGIAVLLAGLPEGGLGALSDARALFAGEWEDDGVGASAADVGDLDGDGRGDLAIGASGAASSTAGAGRVGIWFGPVGSGTWTMADADVAVVGAERGAAAGARLAAGRLDAGAWGDLVIVSSAAGADDDTYATSQGAVHVVTGRPR